MTENEPRIGIETRWPVARIATVTLVVAVLATCASYALLPAALRLVAPVVCPGNAERSVVVLDVRHIGGGRTRSRSELWCVFPDKETSPKRVDGLLVFGALSAQPFSPVATGER
jgi:hypothetical protein